MCNRVAFQKIQWNHKLVCFLIWHWHSVLDYGWAAWAKCLRKISKTPNLKRKVLKQFDSLWCQNALLCSRVDLTVVWNSLKAPAGIG